MKKLILTLGILMGAMGAVNAGEFKGKVTKYYFEQGEVPKSVLNKYNEAQLSLDTRRNILLNELNAEVKKAEKADIQVIKRIACVDMPPIAQALLTNDTALIKYAKNIKSRESIQKNIAANKETLKEMKRLCRGA